VRLLAHLGARGFDTLVYLTPSIRAPQHAMRDRRFFALAGIRRFIGFERFYPFPAKVPGQPLAEVPPEADLLLERIAASGIPVPPRGEGSMELGLGPSEERQV